MQIQEGPDGSNVDRTHLIEGAVYTIPGMIFYQELDVFGAVRKKDEIIKSGIHCISRSSLGTFILRAGTHWSN